MFKQTQFRLGGNVVYTISDNSEVIHIYPAPRWRPQKMTELK